MYPLPLILLFIFQTDWNVVMMAGVVQLEHGVILATTVLDHLSSSLLRQKQKISHLGHC